MPLTPCLALPHGTQHTGPGAWDGSNLDTQAHPAAVATNPQHTGTPSSGGRIPPSTRAHPAVVEEPPQHTGTPGSGGSNPPSAHEHTWRSWQQPPRPRPCRQPAHQWIHPRSCVESTPLQVQCVVAVILWLIGASTLAAAGQGRQVPTLCLSSHKGAPWPSLTTCCRHQMQTPAGGEVVFRHVSLDGRHCLRTQLRYIWCTHIC